jgi:hypothetical protein
MGRMEEKTGGSALFPFLPLVVFFAETIKIRVLD